MGSTSDGIKGLGAVGEEDVRQRSNLQLRRSDSAELNQIIADIEGRKYQPTLFDDPMDLPALGTIEVKVG